MTPDEGEPSVRIVPPPVVEPDPRERSPAQRELDAALTEARRGVKQAERAIERARQLATGNPWLDTVTGGMR